MQVERVEVGDVRWEVGICYTRFVIRSFRDLEIYQLSVELYPQIVGVAGKFPPAGFHLRDQICRAVNAIAADIAEGFGRSVAEFKMYLTRALGSCNEAEAHLGMAKSAGFLPEDEFSKLKDGLNIIGKKIYTLRKKWK